MPHSSSNREIVCRKMTPLPSTGGPQFMCRVRNKFMRRVRNMMPVASFGPEILCRKMMLPLLYHPPGALWLYEVWDQRGGIKTNETETGKFLMLWVGSTRYEIYPSLGALPFFLLHHGCRNLYSVPFLPALVFRDCGSGKGSAGCSGGIFKGTTRDTTLNPKAS